MDERFGIFLPNGENKIFMIDEVNIGSRGLTRLNTEPFTTLDAAKAYINDTDGLPMTEYVIVRYWVHVK